MKGKHIILIITFILCFSLFATGAELNTEQARIMMEHANNALLNKDIDSARMYLRRAIQFNPYYTKAWEKYDELMKI